MMSRGEERRGVPSRRGKNWRNESTGGETHQLCGWMPRCHANCMQRAYMPSLPFAAGERPTETASSEIMALPWSIHVAEA